MINNIVMKLFKDEKEPGYGNNPSQYGPSEHRPFVVMIPVSKIWSFFKKKCKKNKEKRA